VFFGNIMVSLSWFGVNMLGVGLHPMVLWIGRSVL